MGEDSGQFPSFSRTVNREFVHRQAVSEVFLTSIAKDAPAEFTVSAQWPRWHVFYGGLSTGFDSAMVVETLRQLTVLIAHTQLEVPLGRPFLMPQMAIQMVPGRHRDPSRPVEVTAHVDVSEQRQTPNGLVAFRARAVFHADGGELAKGTAAARIIEPVVYNRFRRGIPTVSDLSHAIHPVSADRVGHASSWNVVLGHATGLGRWPLRVDISHPILFDHPLDHVPGVLLIEAIRQALRLELCNPGLDFADFDAEFLMLLDLGIEADVVLESLTEHGHAVTAVVSIRTEDTVIMRAIVHIKQERQSSGDQCPSSLRPGQQALSGPSSRAHG
jgi:2-oxo-3-(phosphooxy)propyl 3-oxoalkanoate synthase